MAVEVGEDAECSGDGVADDDHFLSVGIDAGLRGWWWRWFRFFLTFFALFAFLLRRRLLFVSFSFLASFLLPFGLRLGFWFIGRQRIHPRWRIAAHEHESAFARQHLVYPGREVAEIREAHPALLLGSVRPDLAWFRVVRDSVCVDLILSDTERAREILLVVLDLPVQ